MAGINLQLVNAPMPNFWLSCWPHPWKCSLPIHWTHGWSFRLKIGGTSLTPSNRSMMFDVDPENTLCSLFTHLISRKKHMFILKEPNKISKQSCWVLNIWTNHLNKNMHFWESTSKNQSGSLHIQVTFGFSGFLAHLAAIPTEEACGSVGQEPRSRISSRNKSSGCCRGRMLSKTTCTMGRLDWYLVAHPS